MKEVFLICRLFFCDPEEGTCEEMRTFVKSYPSVQAAKDRRDQYHRSNRHPCEIDPPRIAHWKCSVEER